MADRGTFTGRVDGFDGVNFFGWVVERANLQRAVAVEIREGERLLAAGLADRFRKDLRDSGFGDGRHAFRIPLPPELYDGRSHDFAVVAVGAGPIPGLPGPLTLPAAPRHPRGRQFRGEGYFLSLRDFDFGAAAAEAGKAGEASALDSLQAALTVKNGEALTVAERCRTVRGRLDAFGGAYIEGWALVLQQPAEPAEVEVLDGDRVVARGRAFIFRADVLDAVIGTGRYGFRILLPIELFDDDEHVLSARVAGCTSLLAGGPLRVRLPRRLAAPVKKSSAQVSAPARSVVVAGSGLDARPLLDACIARRGDQYEISEALAALLVQEGHLDGAAAVLRQTLREAPDRPTALMLLGDVHLGLGAPRLADELFASAAAAAPENPIANFNLGCSRLALGDFGGAIAAFSAAANLDPHMFVAHYNLGCAYQAAGLSHFAEIAYRSALACDPYDADVHYNLGLVHMAIGAAAAPSLREALRLDPRHALAAEALQPPLLLGELVKLGGGMTNPAVLARVSKALPGFRRLPDSLVDLITQLRRRTMLSLARHVLNELRADPGVIPMSTLDVLEAQVLFDIFHQTTYHRSAVERQLHLDLATWPTAETPWLEYLADSPDAALEAALARTRAALASSDLDPVQREDLAHLGARILQRLGRADELAELHLEVEASDLAAGREVRLAAAFSHYVAGARTDAQRLLDEAGCKEIFVRYGGVSDVADKTIALAAPLEEPLNIVNYRTLWHRHESRSVRSDLVLSGCRLAVITDALIRDDHGTIQKSNWLLRESINAHPSWYCFDWPGVVASGVEFAMMTAPRVAAQAHGTTVLAAYSRDPHNYAHWILDVLPRILIAASTPELDGTPILVTRALTSWQRELLEILNVDLRRIRDICRQLPLRCERLVVPVTSEGLFYNPEAVRLVRAGLERAGVLSTEAPTRRICVRRNSQHRLLMNGDEIETWLVQQGFQIVDPGRLSVREQIKLYSESAIVVSPEGAALTNMLYMQPGTALIGMGPVTGNGPYFAILSQMLGVKYGTVMGRSIPGADLSYIGWNYEVDLEDVRMALSEVARDVT